MGIVLLAWEETSSSRPWPLTLGIWKIVVVMERPRLRKPDRAELQPGECLCDHCTAKCCRYFALPIETPTTRKDFDYMRWFLLHDRASVFTENNTWYLLVHNACRHLQSDNRCGIYETRPQICRDYTTDDCEYDDAWVYDRYFETPEQVGEYAEAVLPRRPGQTLRTPRPPLLPIVTGG